MKMWFEKHRFARRGSAIIMALVTMMVLLLLGLAVATVSLGTLKNSTADAGNNDAFYAAESAVTSAIEQLKYEVSSYYTQMLEAPRNDYPQLYADFFSAINDNAQQHFDKLTLFEDISTRTRFTIGYFDEAENKCEFLVSCTATTASGAKYQVDGKLYVKKVDIRTSGGVWLPEDVEKNTAFMAGGTLTNTDGFTVNGGNVRATTFVNPRQTQWYLGYSISGGDARTDPSTASKINNCLTYPGFTTPPLNGTDTYAVTVSNTTLNWSFQPKKAVKIISPANVNFTIDSSCSPYAGTDVYCGGNLTMGCRLTGNIYVHGTATIPSSCTLIGNIYCDGDVNINGAVITGTIISGGNVSYTGGNLTGSIYAAKQLAVANISISPNCILYGGTKVSFNGGNYEAVVFSGGDVVAGGMTIKGAVITQNCNLNKGWLTINYSPAQIAAVKSNPQNEFFFSGGGKTELSDDIFMSQSITAQGRQP